MWMLQIFYKELLSLRPLIVAGVIGMALIVVNDIRATYPDPIDEYGSGVAIPFLQSEINQVLGPMLLAVAAGFFQTWIESFRGTWLFLLHRPVNRIYILAAKGILGLSIIWLVTIIPGIILASWAATPGMLPAPFKWSFTTSYFWNCGLLIIPYLGGFLSGLHAGSWWTTKSLPAIASLGGFFILHTPEHAFFSYSPMLAAAGIVLLLVAIRQEVRYREFA